MLTIGLTGGIGSGKTEASRAFSRLGVTVIDTDLLARELVEPGQPALAEISDTFGDDIVTTKGELDRARLRETVFSDTDRRVELETILHPRIRERAIELVDQSKTPYCILVIPLLVEGTRDYPLDRVLVIDVPVEIQRQRVKARDQLSDKEIDAILKAQTSREQRLKVADDMVVNDGSLENLEREVGQLHQRYLELVRGQGRSYR